MKNINFYTPTRVLFGAGRLEELGTVALPGTKALIATTKGKSVKKYGYLDRVIALLAKQGVESVLYDQLTPNPTVKQVNEGAAYALENGCDFVVALGGGSAIDASKMIGIMMKNPGSIYDYIKGAPFEETAPVVAITTTAGTGSEIDPWAVTTNEETDEKLGWGTEKNFAAIAIVDPELMVSVPASFTAYQGMDTFFHCAECFISTATNDMNDMFALEGIKLVTKYLPIACADGKNLEARSQVAWANSLGGYAQFISGCTSEHAMEHAMSGVHKDLTHGVGLLLICDAYYTFFADKPGYAERYEKMAKAMGVDTDALPEAERPMAFVNALKALKKACGVADLKMEDYGLSIDECDSLAVLAKKVGAGMFASDMYTLSDEECASIYRASF